MSSKLKKWIIAGVGFLLVAVIVLVSITFLSGLSTTTVYNLRFVEQVLVPITPSEEDTENPEETPSETPGTTPSETPGDQTTEEGDLPSDEQEPTEELVWVEVFDKDVYLTALEDNNFVVKLSYTATSVVDFTVTSSDPTVAQVESLGSDNYKITYLKQGKTTITVHPTENVEIFDSFVLNVKDNTPVSFKILPNEEVPNIVGENDIYIYADGKDYEFPFDSTKNGEQTNLNLSSLYVIKDYNTEVFEYIFINDKEGTLVIRAKSSTLDTRETITLQSRFGGEEGETVETFTVSVDVRGNYISHIQLVVDETPNFTKFENIYGGGPLNDGERSIESIYFTKDVNIIYVKIRSVYTNGDMFDVTDNVAAASTEYHGTVPTVTKIRPEQGNYFLIRANNYARITFTYSPFNHPLDLIVNYLNVDEESEYSAYTRFLNQDLYKKLVQEETGNVYYEYIYWDARFARNDAITDEEGRIVGFAGGDPECVIVESIPAPEPEVDPNETEASGSNASGVSGV